MLIERKAGRPASVDLAGILYVFKDNGEGQFVAEVEEPDHIQRFLSIPDYGLPKKTPTAVARALPPLPPLTPASAIIPLASTDPAAKKAEADIIDLDAFDPDGTAGQETDPEVITPPGDAGAAGSTDGSGETPPVVTPPSVVDASAAAVALTGTVPTVTTPPTVTTQTTGDDAERAALAAEFQSLTGTAPNVRLGLARLRGLVQAERAKKG